MTTPDPERQIRAGRPGALYAFVIFVSAWLLFQIQPLISKVILPWFGGTPAVWTTCMLFFQLALFAGYAYAHFLSARVPPAGQAMLHGGLLMLACLLLPILPASEWKPTGTENPTLRIVLVLLTSVGLPFFLLSATGPLLQSWFSRTHPGRSPYRLYALSNVGSLLGLVTYPFLIEALLRLSRQAWLWSGGFVLFSLGCAACAVTQMRSAAEEADLTDAAAGSAKEAESAGQSGRRSQNQQDTPGRPTLKRRLFWLALAAVPSIMLLATTNQVCLDVASIPFLWVLPLTLYLVSFILSFAGDRWYPRRTCQVLMPIALILVAQIMVVGPGSAIHVQLLVYFAGLFLTAMFCHGELARLRPEPQYLTGFYLWMSAGGAVGGLFAGLVAPYLFPGYFELHSAIVLAFVLLLIVFDADFGRTTRSKFLIRVAPLVGAALFCVLLLGIEIDDNSRDAVRTMRNFYGVLRVREEDIGKATHLYTLTNGQIVHGSQFSAAHRRDLPTLYYGRTSGVGRAFAGLHREGPRRIGAVGLGVGTVAVYAEAGDSLTFYEIDDDVIEVAGGFPPFAKKSEFDRTNFQFSFLQRSRGRIEVLPGDARLTLERQSPQEFDILVLDAFSSDAIPVHLLTREAFEVYLRHLAPGGIVAVHVSSRHFRLLPVVAGLANEFDLADRYLLDRTNADGVNPSRWALLAEDPEVFRADPFAPMKPIDRNEAILWTDDYSNLVRILADHSWLLGDTSE